MKPYVTIIGSDPSSCIAPAYEILGYSAIHQLYRRIAVKFIIAYTKIFCQILDIAHSQLILRFKFDQNVNGCLFCMMLQPKNFLKKNTPPRFWTFRVSTV
jgi:hypothetical protein